MGRVTQGIPGATPCEMRLSLKGQRRPFCEAVAWREQGRERVDASPRAIAGKANRHSEEPRETKSLHRFRCFQVASHAF